MIASIRTQYNQAFTEEKYQAYIAALKDLYPNSLDFRVAETPIFIDKAFTGKILAACESIVDVIVQPDFIERTNRAIPANVHVPNETPYSDFIAFDFGICENENGELEPQLIEMQGFPTLFCYQIDHDIVTREHFHLPQGYSTYLNGYNAESYKALLQKIILNGHAAESVVLLEIFPHQQKTRVDFYSTQHHIGIQPVCLTELIQEGRNLYYMRNGVKTKIERIYNRIIFDDLQQQTPEVQAKGKLLLEDLAVEWCPHPNWFYRISKFTLPLIQHPYIPHTQYLSDIRVIPTDLENYVLKPLFSFAGQGVVIDVTSADIAAVKDPENWILQRKVKYAEVIPTPDIPAKAEIRIFYFWEPGAPRPVATNNLARLSKGKMIGVRYNQDKTWVGGSLAYFEQ